MISRVKYPEGKSSSHVFMLRSNLDDVEKVVTWGMNRKVRTTLTKHGKTPIITYSDPISVPYVEKCRNVDDMLSKAACHK